MVWICDRSIRTSRLAPLLANRLHDMNELPEYDPRKDAFDSYNVAIAAMRAKLLHERCPAAKRVEVIGDCELYLGDALDVLHCVENVDAVITDPPYGIDRGNGMGGGGTRLAGDARRYKGGEWDKSRPCDDVFTLMLSKSNLHIIWGGNYFSDVLPQSGKWLFWDKCQTMPSYSDGELAWTSLSGDAVKQFTYNGSGMQAKEKERFHPTQKPVALMQWCIDQIRWNAVSILDPFMGSGSTGVACAKAKRSFVGVEKHEPYFDIACERIRKAYRQPDLFVKALEPKPVQEAML